MPRGKSYRLSKFIAREPQEQIRIKCYLFIKNTWHPSLRHFTGITQGKKDIALKMISYELYDQVHRKIPDIKHGIQMSFTNSN